MNKIFLSVVIPAYNEQTRIIPTLTKIRGYLNSQKYSWEVIIVNDGSSDNTGKTVSDFIYGDGRFSLIENKSNRGKGYSIKQGVLRSTGEYMLFSDSDLSTPIEETEKLLVVIKTGFDIAIGSRAMPDSNIIVPQPVWRRTMGKVFNKFIKAVLMNDFHDTQCGFKLFKGDIARELFGELETEGFAFDVAIIYMGIKKGYRIKEVGITWLDDKHSKVHPLTDSSKMLLELLKIYFH